LRLALMGAAFTVSAAHAAEELAPADTSVSALPALTVTAKRGAQATTEGSKSYTTDVTKAATGLNLSVRNTPQSVSVVTRERIDDQKMTSLTEVVQNATGVSAKAIDSVRQTFYSRGSPVANVQIDGMPMAWNTADSPGEVNSNLIIYDRVEFVRGATGLLSGTGNPSASINLVRKHADSKVFKGSAGAEIGSWSRLGANVDLTTPLNQDGSVRLRLAGDASRQASFIDFEESRQYTLYGVVDADLSASTRLSVGLSEQRDDRNGNMWSGLPIWYANGTRTDWDRSKTTAPKWNFWDTQQRTLFATLSHQFDNKWTVQATATHRKNSNQEKVGWFVGSPDRITGLGLEPATAANWRLDHKQNEIGLTATGPLAGNHELTVGLNHSRQALTYISKEIDFSTVSFDTGNFNTWDGSYLEPGWLDATLAQRTTITETGAYAAARFQVTDTLKVIPGARAISWEVENAQAAWFAAYKKRRHHVTPYIGLVQDLGEQLSAYFSYSDIFAPQMRRDVTGSFLEPMTGKNAELGIKGEFLDGGLQGAVAIFHTTQDNLAQREGFGVNVPNTTPPERAWKVIQDAKTQGYELTLTGALTSRWFVDAGWTQFSIKDQNRQDLSTDQPRKMLKVFTRYKLAGDWSGLTIGGGVNWESASYAIESNPASINEKVEQPAYAVANLMLRYEFSQQLSTQINVNNLFDKKYYGNQIGRFGNLMYGEPRNAQVSVKYGF
jgi:outer membrane receptor for ferric coprogen and ferric-rhodotorulic acid